MDRLLDATAPAERDHFWFRGFRRFARRLLRRAAAGRRDLLLLDCGAGTGGNLALLDEVGRAFGVELSWTGLGHAQRAGRRRLARATVARLPFADARFDLVASFDVLYCLPEAEERAAVAEMHRVLRPGGHALVNVAAMPMLRGDHSILGQELRRYTRASLRTLLEDSGFDLVRLTYTNASLFPLLVVVRLLQRLVGLRPPDRADREITVPSAPINAALSAMLALEAAVLSLVDMPFGSSLLCLARRPGTDTPALT